MRVREICAVVNDAMIGESSLVTARRPGCSRASLSEWEDHFCTRTPTLSVNTWVHAHTLLHISMHTHTRTQPQCLHFFLPLSRTARPPCDWRAPYSAQHKVRHHGYNSRDVLSPGDDQYWNNKPPNNTTAPLPSHTPTLLSVMPVLSGVCFLPCWRKLPDLAALHVAWQVCELCQLPSCHCPQPAVSFGKALESWQRALWVKGLGQWQLNWQTVRFCNRKTSHWVAKRNILSKNVAKLFGYEQIKHSKH